MSAAAAIEHSCSVRTEVTTKSRRRLHAEIRVRSKVQPEPVV